MNLKKIALVSIAAVAVAAAPVFAACPDPAPQFGTNDLCPGNVDLGGICAVTGASANATARFWGFNKGNFAVDNTTPNCAEITCGSDNGSWASNDVEPGGDGSIAWLLDAGIPGTFVITGDWAGAGQRTNMIDGCPTTQAPKAGPIMMVGITDQGANGVGSFAITSALKTNIAPDYNFAFIAGTTAGNMALRPVPRPFITGSSRVDTTHQTFNIRSLANADLQQGVYGDGSVSLGEAIQGFKVYQQIVPRGAAVPTNGRGSWTAASALVPLGAPDTAVTVTCATNSDVYFAYSIVGNSGWEGSFVGTSRGGQCGPTLADPGKVKPVPRSPKSVH